MTTSRPPLLTDKEGQITRVDEGETCVLYGRLVSDEGDIVESQFVVSLVATITDERLGVLVGGAFEVDLLPRLLADSTFDWHIPEKHNVIINRDGSAEENHIIDVKFEYNSLVGQKTGHSLHRQIVTSRNRSPDFVLRDGRINGPIVRGISYTFDFVVPKITGEQAPSCQFVGSLCDLGDQWNITGTTTEFDQYYWLLSFKLLSAETAELAVGQTGYSVRTIRSGEATEEFRGTVEVV